MTIAIRIVEISSSAIPPGLGGARVRAVDVQVGKMTAVVPESLRHCFEIVSRDSPLAGAVLRIEEIPVSVMCLECGETTQIETPRFACAGCGGVELALVTGRELSVASIEVDELEEGREARE